jgi:hypothetical protein
MHPQLKAADLGPLMGMQPTGDVELPKLGMPDSIGNGSSQEAYSQKVSLKPQAKRQEKHTIEEDEALKVYLAEFPTVDPSIDQEALLQLFSGMTPESARKVRILSELLLQAQSSPVMPIKPAQDVVVMDLSPGGMPPVIRTRDGFNTVLNFVDSIGGPWPIEWSLPGNDAYAEVKPSEAGKTTHTLVLNAKTKYETTNYTVKLMGLDEPLMFILENSISGITDFKITYKIPKIGPSTSLDKPIGGYGQNGGARNAILDIEMDDLDTFYSTPPLKAVVIPTSQPQLAQVWYYKNKFIVKTRHELAADYERISYGPNGWKVFALSKIEYELVIVTEDGMVRVSLPANMVHNFTMQGN